MSHLTKEQIDDIVLSDAGEPDHLEECALCRVKLTHRRALGARVRSAFTSLHADDGLRDRIHTALSSHAGGAKAIRTKPSSSRVPRRLYLVLAAAAAVILVAVPITLFVATGNRVQADQMELVRMHEHNLGDGHDYLHSSDFNALATHFREQMGHNPAAAGIGTHLPLHGCCVHRFRGQAVATYVVRSTEGLVTVLTLTEEPRALGLSLMHKLSRPDREIWGAVCGRCNMAGRRVGEQTYYAMGRVSHATLADVLSR